MHVLIVHDLDRSPDEVAVAGDEARRALKVKRLSVGETVRLIDGRGSFAEARVVAAKRGLTLRITSRGRSAPVVPAVHVFSAVPKGPRLAQLIDNLVQAGAASWTPTAMRRSVAEPSEARLARLERVAAEAVRQSQRHFLMAIRGGCSFAHALDAGPDESVLLADPSGAPLSATGSASIRLIIGPEGGFAPDELDEFIRRHVGAGDDGRGAARRGRIISLGPHVMRIELAAAVGTALVLAAEQAARR